MINFQNILERDITKNECLELFYDDEHIFEIMNIANLLRKRIVGDVVTYIMNANINYTNICSNKCKFCAFRKSKYDKNSYFMTPKEVGLKARKFQQLGATEFCIQGGVYEKVDTYYQIEILKSIKYYTSPYGKTTIHAFSPMDIKCGSENAGLDIKSALILLKEAGLNSMPGTAAEILVDNVREELCPEKIKTSEWENIIRIAHNIGIPRSSTIMYGHIESYKDIVEHLFKIKNIQNDTKGFTEFILLPYLNENTDFKKNKRIKISASGILDMKVTAISRILFKDVIKNIQVPWVKLGIKFSQVCLMCGANDYSGSMIEDDISKSAGANFGTFMTKEMYQEAINSIGRIPKERNTFYEYI